MHRLHSWLAQIYQQSVFEAVEKFVDVPGAIVVEDLVGRDVPIAHDAEARRTEALAGDVRRVVLRAPGFAPERIYQRGRTWGQFDGLWNVIDGSLSLRIYGKSGLLEVVRLAIEPGQTRVFH